MTRSAGRTIVLALAMLLVLTFPLAGNATSITVDGTSNKVGALPTMITAFHSPATGDVLPAGGTDWYVFTLYDTGATRVFFDASTAAALGVSNGMTLDVRINGLAQIDPITLNAPIYTGAQAPQAEVTGVPVALPASPPDRTLIGGPVTNTTGAIIDYTTTVTRGPYAVLGGGDVSGPDISFFTGTPSYVPAVQLSLEPFGATAAGLGQRYWMYDVAFNEGASSVASPASGELGTTDTRFLYDTGTTVTIMSAALAGSLGLTGPAQFPISVGGSVLDGYWIDSITMTGVGGTYTVLSAPIAVTDDPGLLGAADAIIGSNLFSQTKLLFDGPDATLGIGVESGDGGVVPEPSTLTLVGFGLAGLLSRLRRRGSRRP